MEIKINCISNDGGSHCTHKKVKRSLFGLGARCCSEFRGEKCELKELRTPKVTPPPSPAEKAKSIKKEKFRIRKKLMERYDIPEERHEIFWAYSGDDDIHPIWDEDGSYIDFNIGDIVPYKRRGVLVFFYEITKYKSKYGDWGWGDYADFYDLKYHHSEKIPEKKVDPSKSLKIGWTVISEDEDEKIYDGHIQGIKVCTLTRDKKHTWLNTKVKFNSMCVEMRGIKYPETYEGITEAKKKTQDIITTGMKDENGKIEDNFIPPKFRRRNNN
jgi:hypothetical protein